jgi:hypothetical protein
VVVLTILKPNQCSVEITLAVTMPVKHKSSKKNAKKQSLTAKDRKEKYKKKQDKKNKIKQKSSSIMQTKI